MGHQRGFHIEQLSSHCGKVVRGFNIACHDHTVEWYYRAPTWLQHCLLSLHCGAVLQGTNAACRQEYCGAVLRGTNAASTSTAIIAQWHCSMGHQRGFDIVKLSLHGGAVLRGTNVASTLSAVIAQWRGMGHQCGFNVASSHCTVELYYGAPTRCCRAPGGRTTVTV